MDVPPPSRDLASPFLSLPGHGHEGDRNDLLPAHAAVGFFMHDDQALVVATDGYDQPPARLELVNQRLRHMFGALRPR